jgi:hypothetical protein
MFSPILPIRPLRTSSTVGPKPSCDSASADSAATSPGFCSATSLAHEVANARNESFFDTKSVSQLISTSAPVVPSTAAATTPSAVMRAAALPALLPSLTRRISSARLMSPSASVRAFLHSIIGASVFARSSPTMLAVIAAILKLRNRSCEKGALEPLLALGPWGAQASSDTSTNSSLPADCAASTMLLTALALPSSTASATARAYSATALAESSLPGIT